MANTVESIGAGRMQEFASTGTSLSALARQYQAIAHNLANSSTVGFKREVSQFQQVFDQVAADLMLEGGQRVGEPVVNHTRLDFTQGTVLETNRKLDLALEGEGFFVVEAPNGPQYTRAGSFRVSPNGQLVDGMGRTVAGKDGPITIPDDVSTEDLFVGFDGTISAPGGKKLGTIRVVEFENNNQLKPLGDACYEAPAGMKPKEAEETTIQQGYLENSNVSAVEELIKLIRVTRLYEAGVKTISAQDERMKNLLRVAMG